MGFEVLTEELLSATAVEALATQLRVICAHTLANLETVDALSYGRDNTDSLVTRNERELENRMID